MAHTQANRLAGPPAVRRLCMAVDIESYSSRTMPEQVDLQNRLHWTVYQALQVAGIHPAHADLQVSGDGVIIILPPGVDERMVYSGLVNGLLSGLDKVNANPGPAGRVRMRAALGQGSIQNGPTGFASHAVIVVCRLLDSKELHQALRDAKAANAAFIVTDDLYGDLVVQGYGGLPASGFREVRVTIPEKKFDDQGWIQVPIGVPSPAQIPAYGDNRELQERQQAKLEAGGTVAAAVGLAWAALAGRHDPHVSAIESTMIGAATHGLVPESFLPGNQLNHGIRGGSTHGGSGHDATHDSGGHETAASEEHELGHSGHGSLPLGPLRSTPATAPATSSSGEADPPPNTQAGLAASTGQAAIHGGLAAQLEVVEATSGAPGSGYSAATAVESTQYRDGTHSVAVAEVTEHRTADGVELTGGVERATGLPGHETVQDMHFREEVHVTPWGHEVDGVVGEMAGTPGHEEQQEMAFQADYVGSAETGYHLADLHEEYSPVEHADPGHYDTHTELA